ncbi:uncharacterized protein LOC106528675 isoform X2 [Austrofundulus limnaeus]|nr:PREDICTED: uncharacterized protein LOC106528675 isoform X2 [Austrofundulus limnaeus]XP_013879362.1 PREDICTED: uncharacterized protein LOC106528675 isoform X2 [Austrofundulus limnaeus]
MMEDGEDIQKAESSKRTGRSNFLLGTGTRSSREDPSETGPEENHESEDELSRRRHRNRRRARCWSRFSSAVLCIRKSLENPPEVGTPRPEDVPLKDRGDKRFRMTRVLRRLRTPEVQRARGQNRGSPKSFQKKLQRFFIWGQKRRPRPGDTEDTKVEEDPDAETAESPETLVVQGQAAEGPEPPTETSEVLTNTEPDQDQSVETNQVPVEVVSLEDDEVFVDLHDPLHEETRASQSCNPSINGPAIRIQVCPPQDFIQEEDWDSGSPSENHLHLLFSSDHMELQLLQTARLLVRTALRAAVDQLSREQQNQNQNQDRDLDQALRRAEPGGALPVSSLLNVRF